MSLEKITVADISVMKTRGEKIAALTAYDYPMARMLDETGIPILLVGDTVSFETAFYSSAQNYTALGYGDVVLTGPGRLLGPLEAINGLLLFGLSTAALFAVLSRLVAGQLPSRPSGAGPAASGH